MAAPLQTRQLPIQVDGYRCYGGPMSGEMLFLSENSLSSGYITQEGWRGRYVYAFDAPPGPRLEWEPA